MEAASTVKKTACLVALLTLATLCSAHIKDNTGPTETIRVTDIMLREKCQRNPELDFCVDNPPDPTVDKQDFSRNVRHLFTHQRLRHRVAALADHTVDRRDFSRNVHHVFTHKRLRHRGAALADHTDTDPDGM
ncbi:uncharacterized protein LOC112569197 isoform X2 [Pomacea canaliculata]|uniref:uncharacterized protein LOC112569197 isoform X2 n=1 Tax=Pomacea canaliculata TaxID=400727 RepID=UPI000D73DF2A|nr:uncharacterized protein LOC112569197 isoform X2 [Pomacea canaliculata]